MNRPGGLTFQFCCDTIKTLSKTSAKGTENMKNQTQIDITAYKSDGFIGKYQKLIKDVVIPYQYSVLCDEAPET